jgi:endonuclease/exonuclease/phosphatase family metal-dependent hydrolase
MIHRKVDKGTARALKVLGDRIEKSKVPSSLLDEQILIASWNIREFGRKRRTEKAIHLIAEILSYFDLVALQELRGDLRDLGRVMEVLGPYWKVVFSDVTEGRQGNEERMAYLYDKRAVVFTGLAAEAVVPPLRTREDGKTVTRPSEQFWRTPYMASFRAGTFDFVLISVHVQWGTTGGREVELGRIADWVEARRKSKFATDKDIILMGDFNVPKRGDRFFKAITRHGLEVPSAFLGSTGSNLEPLFPDLTKRKFTYQLSDHLPLWLVVKTETADEELDQILNPPEKKSKTKAKKKKAKKKRAK